MKKSKKIILSIGTVVPVLVGTVGISASCKNRAKDKLLTLKGKISGTNNQTETSTEVK
ncbi:hypothetical protein NW739_06890 [Mycoplasmopsis felis]|uniref:hypothetical protein n=1 Tax=Mycoplasmopsis felis TaxID=33923 RepID=UPI0021B01F0C|nr:hypothetical protein [Mycoplasmopsis felis]MCU9934787.1 hypothetical protein [Mycoplasmopsis felis]MCU9939184.1 hypothetical protein [Mycoplasmopsis felis]MCU9940359.1 hypothetical protein [Mycoplasmopsis felis]UWV79342.1 hypothetical protein NW072_04775 [Mycoplasmopsis felis]UWV85402.1 hypothetical protein NW066_01615 [Mycoplasmopsis felis]